MPFPRSVDGSVCINQATVRRKGEGVNLKKKQARVAGLLYHLLAIAGPRSFLQLESITACSVLMDPPISVSRLNYHDSPGEESDIRSAPAVAGLT